MAICEICGVKGRLHIHHIDGNHGNDVPENKKVLCNHCHHLAHIELWIAKTGRPGTKPLSERLPYGIPFPKLPLGEVKQQYKQCFPRA
jgi:5-methylcytosine-specific restriction endonuclease McrA